MSGRIVSYKIVVGKRTDEFSERINKRLGEGWKLYGTPFNSNGFLCQAMVKEATE